MDLKIKDVYTTIEITPISKGYSNFLWFIIREEKIEKVLTLLYKELGIYHDVVGVDGFVGTREEGDDLYLCLYQVDKKMVNPNQRFFKAQVSKLFSSNLLLDQIQSCFKVNGIAFTIK